MIEKVLVAITGASGFPLAITLLETLQAKGIERHLVVSENAWKVLEYEHDMSRDDVLSLASRVYLPSEIHTSICSGTYPIDAMVVIPCSINTLGHIGNGIEHNAITRAAGVNIKQERKVVLVVRDSPLSLPALKNMVKAREAGCSIVPPMLTYYHKPENVQGMTNHAVGKVLSLLGVEHELTEVWDK